METAVRKATRLEYLPPKQKHLTTLKNLTLENPSCIDSMMSSLEKRLKERSWIITFKVLVIIHYLMREGNSEAVIESVTRNPSVLDSSRIKNKSSVPASVQNIYLYRAYLDERIIAFRNLKRDFVKETLSKKEGRLRHLLVSEGLLKETSALQRQIANVLKCKFYMEERDPAITLFAYRMTIEDLLALFQAVNEGVVNILEHYFEMNKTDAIEALKIYKKFAQQTESTITHLKEAKKFQNDLQMDIPTVSHAPLSLATALEEYLNDENPIENSKKNAINDRKQAAPSQSNSNLFQTSQPLQQQQNQTQVFSLPIQTQPEQLQQPLYNSSVYQPQLQNSMHENVNGGYNQYMNSFSSQQQIMSSPIQQASSPNSNPFASISNSQQQLGFGNTSPNVQYPTVSTINQNSFSNNIMRSNTVSSVGNSGNNNHNPFRTLSVNYGSNDNQPLQLIPVAKPTTLQTGLTNHHNPFSPISPPLTPNNQAFFNSSNNNMSMQPYQQQPQQQPSALPFQSTSNPFLTQ